MAQRRPPWEVTNTYVQLYTFHLYYQITRKKEIKSQGKDFIDWCLAKVWYCMCFEHIYVFLCVVQTIVKLNEMHHRHHRNICILALLLLCIRVLLYEVKIHCRSHLSYKWQNKQKGEIKMKVFFGVSHAVFVLKAKRIFLSYP